MKLKKTGAVFLLVAALLMTGMPAAFADSPPTVQTLKPTKMYVYYAGGIYYPDGIDKPWRWRTEDVRARLNGSVNPGGGACKVYFEYGTTTAYGSTASVGTVSGTSAVSVSAALTGLRAATLYHCRLVAVSDSGIVYGQDLAFIPSCDPYAIYYNFSASQVQYWNSHYLLSSDPTGNIAIVASLYDKADPMAYFDIMNYNPFDVSLDYTANGTTSGTTTSGTDIIGSMQNQQIWVPKASVCAFSYNYSLFKQVLTNDQDYEYLETPLPRNKVEMYFMGSLANGYAGMYSINNRNTQEVTLELQAGSEIYTVSVPASSVAYFLAPTGTEVQASLDGEPFMVLSPTHIKWHGAAFVTLSPLGFGDTTATFELQNNDDTAHSVKLKNAGGVTHAYTLAPYEHQTVTIEKSDWDVYLYLPNLPQPNISGWVDGGYVKISSVSPGAAVLPLLTVSGATLPMGAYGGSDSSLYVTGGGDWTAVSDQPWLNVSPAAGSGFSWLTMTASANTSSSSRSAVVTVSDGTTAKTVTVTQTGYGWGNALSFDGVYDAVSILDNDDTITDAVTLEAWVKWEPESSSDIQFICGKGSEQMELHAGGSANSLRFIPTPGVYLDAASVLPTGIWNHVAAVYQPSSALAKLYINGNEVTLTNNGAQPVTTSLAASSTSFALGSRGNGNYPFKGELDDFRIWNRALTQNEIRLNMVNPVIPSGQTGLVSAYNFNQGAAGGDNAGVTVLVDETGYRSGSLYGFALNGDTSNWVASGAGEGLEGHTLTYNGNGATSGSAPTDSLSYVSGAEATVKAASGLAKTGSSFGGWNTQADGGGTTCFPGAMLTMPASNVTLYARWLSGWGKYTVTPAASAAYTVGTTAAGFAAMTVKSGVTGLKAFTVNIGVTESHTGNETAVFTQFRNGVQIALGTVNADFDQQAEAVVSFNVQPDDVVKVHIVDTLTNAEDANPTLLQ